jgi:23S rRNA (guanine745-N1)-methyltransferase
MKKKIDKAADYLRDNPGILACPICQTPFHLDAYALTCENAHTYNINKKGYANVLAKKADTEQYTRAMFEPRARMINAGMYQGVLDVIRQHLAPGATLDVGTGEGSFLNLLAPDLEGGPRFGFDIAKDGIEMATNQPQLAFWLLADLTKLPFATNSITNILNIFTPSNYQEFARVLNAEQGRVIKVVPDRYYLQELREAYGLPVDYDNTKVVEKFQEHYQQVDITEVQYTFPIPEQNRTDILRMSPLEWQVPEAKLQALEDNPPTTITVHVKVLVGSQPAL